MRTTGLPYQPELRPMVGGTQGLGYHPEQSEGHHHPGVCVCMRVCVCVWF
jgi:hypothetical protein